MLRTRIFWKTLTAFAALGLGTAAVLAWLVLGAASGHLQGEIETGLHEKTLLLRDLCSPYARAGDVDELQSMLRDLALQTRARYTLIGADGVVLADSDHDPARMESHGSRPEVLQAKTDGVGSTQRRSDTSGRRMLYMVVPLRDPADGFARAALPLDGIEALHSDLRRRFFLGAALAFLFALLPGFLASRRVVAPIVGLTRAAEEFSRTGSQVRVRWDSNDEIGDLAGRFNDMTRVSRDRLETITQDRNKLAAILAGMVEGVVAVDREERILHINQAAVRMLGEVDSSEGRHIWELPWSREVSDIVSRCLEQDMVLTAEARLPEPSGFRHVELFASPLRHGDGRLRGSAVVLHDVTRLRRLEEVRRDFVANASHELKTPITAIIALVETLLDDEEAPPETRVRFLGKIRDQSRRLSALVQDLITLSRVESDLPEEVTQPTDFTREVREAAGALAAAAAAKDIRLEAELTKDAALVAARRQDLRDVVENLVDNAIKYTPPGGAVTVRLFVDDVRAVLEVADTGIGIEPAHQARVFERFYRVDSGRSRDQGGTGLGLSIVRNVAQTLRGSVSLSSEPGAGSRFRFEVPLATAGFESRPA